MIITTKLLIFNSCLFTTTGSNKI